MTDNSTSIPSSISEAPQTPAASERASDVRESSGQESSGQTRLPKQMEKANEKAITAETVESQGAPKEAQPNNCTSDTSACSADEADNQVCDASLDGSNDSQEKPSRIKRWLKYIGLAVLFCAILLVLLVPVSYVLHPKTNSKEAGMDDERTYAVLAEPEQTIDALFIGNSIVATSITPMEIWENAGYTSYVCAANGERMTFVYYLLECTFKEQSPSIVFIETDFLFDPTDAAHLVREVIRETYPGLLYHYRWCSLTADDFTKPIQFDNVLDNKGYNAKGRTHAAEYTGYINPTEEVESLSTLNYYLLKQVVDLCNEHGTRVVLLSTPTAANWTYQRHNGAAVVAEELGIDYLEMNIGPYTPDIDWSTDTRDYGNHLNWRGASKTTKLVADYLEEQGFVDHRGDQKYSAWNDSLVRYHDYMKELQLHPEQYDAEGPDV